MKKTKRIFSILLAVVLLCHTVISTLCITASAASPYAESFDHTAIEDDLSGVDLKNYPKNPMGEVDIISFVEYSYSNQSYLSEYYGLYIYVYNPTGKDITITNGNNFVNALVGFDENGTEIYESVNLEYLDKTSDDLIYKFKLSRSSEFLNMAREYALDHEGKRLYKIIELEVKHGKDIANAEISKEYVWSGFAAYCGDDSSAVSTLECTDFGTRSIHLNLLQTNYRFEVKEGESSDYMVKPGTICDELNSVFFTISDAYFEDFGNLNKVKAEWYEYKTSPMYVTSDKDAYSALWNMRNVFIDERGRPADANGNTLDPIEGWERCYFRVFWDEGFSPSDYGLMTLFGQTYNGLCRDDINDSSIYTLGGYKCVIDSWRYESKLDWLFYVEDSLLDPSDYCVSKDRVKAYMIDYTNDFSDQERIRGKYASDLFTDSIDADRIQFLEDPSAKSGYVNMEFCVDDEFEFTDSDKSQTAWNKFWFGTKYENVTYSPIEVISAGDLYYSAEEFSEKYYVNPQDASNIMTEARRAYSDGEIPMLLRFAVTDYYASTARFDYAEENDFDMSEQDGYVAQETMFLDFDVLSLTFQSEDGYNEVAIGVVATPIDIINGLTPPASLVEDEEWWQKLVALIMLVIIILVVFFLLNNVAPWLGTIFKAIFTVISWILSLIFDLLTWPFRSIGQIKKRSSRRAPSSNKSRKKKRK